MRGPGFSWLLQPSPACASHLPPLFLCHLCVAVCGGGPSHPGGKTTALLIRLSPALGLSPPDGAPSSATSSTMSGLPHALRIPVPGATLFTACRSPLKASVSALEDNTPSECLQERGWSTRDWWPSLSALPSWPLLSRLCLCLGNVCAGLGSQAGGKGSRSHKAKAGGGVGGIPPLTQGDEVEGELHRGADLGGVKEDPRSICLDFRVRSI